VSWCTRSVHAVNGSWTDHVHGPCMAVHTVCTWPWTAVYTGRKHGRVFASRVQGRTCTGYMIRAVYRLCTRPCTGRVRTWSVHDLHTTVYGYAPCTRACLRKVYTAVHDRVHDHCMAVYNVLQSRGRPRILAYKLSCSWAAKANKPVYRVRSPPCTQSVKTTVCRVHGHVRAVYMAVFGSCTAVYQVHTRCEQRCTRAVNTPRYRVHGRVHGHVQGT